MLNVKRIEYNEKNKIPGSKSLVNLNCKRRVENNNDSSKTAMSKNR